MRRNFKLAIVGRPNVGKSALFNRICGQRIAIVEEEEGITRDRLYAKADFFGFPFEVIDTGGIDSHSKAAFNELIKRQAEIAILEADAIIMVVDGRVGLTQLDQEIASLLLKTKKPLCLAVNKIDSLHQEGLLHEFYALGIEKKIPVSATQNWHIAELLEAIFSGIEVPKESPLEDEAIRIAIVGRPNVGKSSLLNTLLSEERCIVSPIPGTTRDSIDVPFQVDGNDYRLIDTAGIRRKNKESEVVDKFSFVRTKESIERSDICVLVLDAAQGITSQEKKIANMIEEAGKGCLILLNKWDLVKGFRMEHCLQGIEEEVPFLKHCPKIFISAKTGRNVDKIFPEIQKVYQASQMRVSTGRLNTFIEKVMQLNHPPMIQGKRLRIYYMTQIGIAPATFVLFINYPNLMTDTYKKYILNQFRATFGFLGIPLILHLKPKRSLNPDSQSD